MASPVGHGLVGMGLAAAVADATGAPASPTLWLGAVVASGVPDLDLIGVIFGLSPRRVHRHATHSLLVLGGLTLVAMWAWTLLPGSLEPGLVLAWMAALLSHPVLDLVTTGPAIAARGFGIALLWPVLSKRWFLREPLFHTGDLSACRSAGDVWRAFLPDVYFLGPVSIAIALLGHLL